MSNNFKVVISIEKRSASTGEETAFALMLQPLFSFKQEKAVVKNML